MDLAKLRDYIHPVNLKEINPEFSLEGLLLKLKRQSFCYLMWRADSLEKKTLLLGKIEGKRLRWQRMRSLDSTTDSTDMNMGQLWEIPGDRGAQCATIHGVTKSWTWLSNWTTTLKRVNFFVCNIYIYLSKLDWNTHTHTHTHTMHYHYTCTKTAKIKKTDHIKINRSGHGAMETLRYCW